MHEACPCGFRLEEYGPEMSDEAVALESLCTQGGSFRLAFRRTAFHRRAENFRQHRIIVAREHGRLVGVIAAAIKDVELAGRCTRAAFLFDLRVHPSLRRRGIARSLVSEATSWSFSRAEIAYTYCVFDNRILPPLARIFGGQEAAGYAYLVIPAVCAGEPDGGALDASFAEVHETMREVVGPFDFYANPTAAMARGAHAGSWMLRRNGSVAGCSAWSNREILAEVVRSVPIPLRVFGALQRSIPRLARAAPLVPRRGQELRSWYLFDFFASDEESAMGLVRTMAGAARREGIDYLYLPHPPGDVRAAGIRERLPRLFSPVIPYRMLARMRDGRVPRIRRLYVDVRDL